MILNQGAALECPTFPVNPQEFRVPEERLAAILGGRTIHGTRWVSQDTFLKIHLFPKGHPHRSSRSQGI